MVPKKPTTTKKPVTKKSTTIKIKQLPGYPYGSYGISGPPAPYDNPK